MTISDLASVAALFALVVGGGITIGRMTQRIDDLRDKHTEFKGQAQATIAALDASATRQGVRYGELEARVKELEKEREG